MFPGSASGVPHQHGGGDRGEPAGAGLRVRRVDDDLRDICRERAAGGRSGCRPVEVSAFAVQRKNGITSQRFC